MANLGRLIAIAFSLILHACGGGGGGSSSISNSSSSSSALSSEQCGRLKKELDKQTQDIGGCDNALYDYCRTDKDGNDVYYSLSRRECAAGEKGCSILNERCIDANAKCVEYRKKCDGKLAIESEADCDKTDDQLYSFIGSCRNEVWRASAVTDCSTPSLEVCRDKSSEEYPLIAYKCHSMERACEELRHNQIQDRTTFIGKCNSCREGVLSDIKAGGDCGNSEYRSSCEDLLGEGYTCDNSECMVKQQLCKQCFTPDYDGTTALNELSTALGLSLRLSTDKCLAMTVNDCSLGEAVHNTTIAGSCGVSGDCSYKCEHGVWSKISSACISCTATTKDNCKLTDTASDVTAVGRCAGGYKGSCSYACSDSIWSKASNTCSISDCFVISGNTITGYKDTDSDGNACTKHVVIPHGVTSIGYRAFYSKKLSSVRIPDSVTSIGREAFSGLYPKTNSLTSLTIPSSVTSIGVHAFIYNKIKKIIIPSSVTSIGAYAFSYNRLSSVCIEASQSSITVDAKSFWRGYSLYRTDRNITPVYKTTCP